MKAVATPRKNTTDVGVRPNSIAAKMAEDKKSIIAYIRGEISRSDLDAKGVKFVKAL